MANEWKTGELGSYGEFRNGVNFNREQEGIGLPILKVKDFGDLVLCPLDGLDELDANTFSVPPDQLLADDDIVIIRSNGNPALVGRSVVVQNVTKPTTFSGFCIRFRPDSLRLNPRFAAYFLRSPITRDRMTRFGSGTGIQNLNQSILAGLPIDLPELGEQQAIVAVLGSLDDKIEQNRRTGRALEGLARVTFKAWFVDFEPVKAKAAGAAGFPGMPSAAFAALPDRLTDSSIGPVPEGWEVRPLSEVCQIVSGGTPKRSEANYWGGDIPWYSVKDAPAGGMPWVYFTDEQITQVGLDGSAATLVPVGCTIISARGTVGRLALAGRSMTFNQSCYGLLPKDGKSYRHLYLLVRQVVSELQQRTHGSVFDTITRQTFDGVDVVLPPSALIEHFELAVTPLFDLLLALLWESRKLAELRDYLLPRLLSGTVRVEALND
jgi:type I restriction enzyme S subunit